MVSEEKLALELLKISGGTIIGQKSGNSGTVYIIDNGEHASPKRIAYKTLRIKNILDSDKKKEFVEECEQWFNLKSHYCITPFYSKIILDVPVICMPYCPYDLKSLLENTKLSDSEALVVASQIAKSLMMLQKMGLKNHQDLNPPNILIRNLNDDFSDYPKNALVNLDIKISDFGMANLRERIGPTIGGNGGKFPFKAPEQYFPKKYFDYSPDVFAFGVILHMLITGKHPNGLTNIKTLNKNTSESKFKKWCFTSPRITLENKTVEELINTMLQEDPSSRPKINNVFDLLMAELKKSDLIAFTNLELRFKYYDTLDNHDPRSKKLETLINISLISGSEINILEKLKILNEKIESSTSNPFDAIYKLKILSKIIFSLCKENADKHEILHYIENILTIIDKNHSYIKVHHAYPPCNFEGTNLLKSPDFKDYEITAGYVTFIVEVLDKIESKDFIDVLFQSKSHVLQSMYWYSRAFFIRQTDIANTILFLNKANNLHQSESLFSYVKYLWIKHYLILNQNLNKKEKFDFTKISLLALVKAKTISPDWNTLKKLNLSLVAKKSQFQMV